MWMHIREIDLERLVGEAFAAVGDGPGKKVSTTTTTTIVGVVMMGGSNMQ